VNAWKRSGRAANSSWRCFSLRLFFSSKFSRRSTTITFPTSLSRSSESTAAAMWRASSRNEGWPWHARSLRPLFPFLLDSIETQVVGEGFGSCKRSAPRERTFSQFRARSQFPLGDLRLRGFSKQRTGLRSLLLLASGASLLRSLRRAFQQEH